MSKLIREFLTQRKLAKWNNTPKDLVILHTFGRNRILPSASPYVMKVQTYLRMTDIKYKMDGKNPFGPKGKAPWVSLNGVHVADSEHIIPFLNRTFTKDLNKGHTEKQLALAKAVRIMLEEQHTWGMTLERFVYNPQECLKVFGTGTFRDTYILKLGNYLSKRRTRAQGIGLHSREEVEEFIYQNLRAVSTLLGNNKFILGDKPCQDDCGIFGQLSQSTWGLPNSNYQKLVHNDLTNLKDYCYRIKELYYPDWDELISSKKKSVK